MRQTKPIDMRTYRHDGLQAERAAADGLQMQCNLRAVSPSSLQIAFGGLETPCW